MPAVKSVRALGSATYRISSDRGPASAQELIELARDLKLELKSSVGAIHQLWTTYFCITPATG